MIDIQVKNKYGSWRDYAELQDENPTNFKRKILQNIDRINKWIEPAGMQIQIVLKKQKRVGKNIKTENSTTDD